MLGMEAMVPPIRMRADELLKHNIDALLRARGQSRGELARWCHQSRSWADKFMTEGRRGIPAKYLDRIADFFGIATYQLLQPGISPLTERRSGTRRTGRDRRISNAVLSQRPGDVDLMDIIRALSRPAREKAIGILGDILSDDIAHLRARPTSAGGQENTDETGSPTHAPKRGHRRSG